MTIKRRLTRLEARLHPPTRRGAAEAQREYWEMMWRIYGQPGDPPPPEEPIPDEEFEAVLSAVNGRLQWLAGEGPEPPAVRRPAYLVEWIETGRVAHPLVRYILYALTGGRYGGDEEGSAGSED